MFEFFFPPTWTDILTILILYAGSSNFPLGWMHFSVLTGVLERCRSFFKPPKEKEEEPKTEESIYRDGCEREIEKEAALESMEWSKEEDEGHHLLLPGITPLPVQSNPLKWERSREWGNFFFCVSRNFQKFIKNIRTFFLATQPTP